MTQIGSTRFVCPREVVLLGILDGWVGGWICHRASLTPFQTKRLITEHIRGRTFLYSLLRKAEEPPLVISNNLLHLSFNCSLRSRRLSNMGVRCYVVERERRAAFAVSSSPPAFLTPCAPYYKLCHRSYETHTNLDQYSRQIPVNIHEGISNKIEGGGG